MKKASFTTQNFMRISVYLVVLAFEISIIRLLIYLNGLSLLAFTLNSH